MGVMKKNSSHVNHVKMKTKLIALSNSVLPHLAPLWFPCFPLSRRHMTATTTEAVVAAMTVPEATLLCHAAIWQSVASLTLLRPPVPLTYLSNSLSLSLSLSPSPSLILSQLTDT